MGGGAAADAAIAEPRSLDRLVLLGATPTGPPEALAVRKLYIMTRDDTSGDGPRLPALQAHVDRAPQPKELIVLEGSAHAQFIFETDQAARVMREIVRFLSEPCAAGTTSGAARRDEDDGFASDEGLNSSTRSPAGLRAQAVPRAVRDHPPWWMPGTPLS